MKRLIVVLVLSTQIVRADSLVEFADEWLCESNCEYDYTGDDKVNLKDFAQLILILSTTSWGQTMTWQDDSAIASKVWQPLAMFRGKMICGETFSVGTSNGGTDNGIILTDGISADTGAMPANCYMFLNAWGIDDCGVFVTAQASGGTKSLQKSANGKTAFTTCAGVTVNGSLGRSLVDCGRHTMDTGDGAGNVERRVLLFFDYPTGAALNTARVYYSAKPADADAGNNGTWTDLFSNTCPAIDHFHGAVYIKGKGLYAMTGDGGTEPSILFCAEADIPSLITSPATWYTRWALGAGARSGWSGEQKTAYILTGGIQDSRTVDFITADGKYAYYICDALPPNLTSPNGSNRIYKVDLFDTTASAAGTMSVVKNTGILNEGWYGGISKSGLVYITTASFSGAAGWITGCDGIMEIYCIDPETGSIDCVKRIPAASNPLWTDQEWLGIGSPLMEFGGSMTAQIGGAFVSRNQDTGALWIDKSLVCGYVKKQKQQQTNIITSTDLASTLIVNGWSIYNRIAYQTGSVAVVENDILEGQTSGVQCKITGVVAAPTGGSWVGGDATGAFNVLHTDGTQYLTGDFVEGEVLAKVSGETRTPVAVVKGFQLRKYVTGADIPAGISASKALRVRCVAKGDVGSTGALLNLSAAQDSQLKGKFTTISFKLWISPTTATTGATRLAPLILFQARPYEWSLRRKTSQGEMSKGQWITISGTTFTDDAPAAQAYYIYPNYGTNSQNDIEVYLAEVEVHATSIANREIQPIDIVSSILGGRDRYNFSN
jgi:hypothetical protein